MSIEPQPGVSEAGITLLLQGEGAAEASQELVRLVGAFAGGAVARVVPPEEAPEEVRRVIDPVSAAALVVSIPAAVLAVIDVVERIEKRRRAARLIEEGRRLRGAKAVQAFVVMPDGGPKRLDDLTPDQLLDLVAELRRRAKAG
jgi:hypothetical protein